MGLFDRFKRKDNINNEQEKTNNIKEYIVHMSNNMNVMVHNIQKENEVVNSEGQIISTIVKARIIEYEPNECVKSDLSDYIVFEIPEGKEINQEMIYCIIQNYYMQRPYMVKNEYTYLGRMFENENGYIMGEKDNSVSTYVQNNMNPNIKREKEELIAEENQSQENDREEFIESIDAREYLQEQQEIRNQRIQNPTIQYRDMHSRNGEVYENYDGININTGEILKLRNMDKIGRDENGTYLYSGYIYNTKNTTDLEFLDLEKQNIASYVCFELPRRLSDIVMENNREDIQRLLELLSDEKNYENKQELKYIGRIDSKNMVTRDNVASSIAIQDKIEELKRMQQIERENMQRE